MNIKILIHKNCSSKNLRPPLLTSLGCEEQMKKIYMCKCLKTGNHLANEADYYFKNGAVPWVI